MTKKKLNDADPTPTETNPTVETPASEVTTPSPIDSVFEDDFGAPFDESLAPPEQPLTEQTETTPAAEPEAMETPSEPVQPPDEPVTDPDSVSSLDNSDQVSQIELVELDAATIDRITTVMIQTGASKSGAQKMLDKMTDEEKSLIAVSITVTDGLLRITDAEKYFAAFDSFNDRIYKASVEPVSEPSVSDA